MSASVADHEVIGLILDRHTECVAWSKAMSTCETIALRNGRLDGSNRDLRLLLVQLDLSKNLPAMNSLVLGSRPLIGFKRIENNVSRCVEGSRRVRR